jgi:DNA-binding Xre family transcriptional regulator
MNAILLQSEQKGGTMAKIRLKVKEVAEAKGISMTMLSHKSYVAINTIRTIFRNPYRTVNTETLERLAEALDVSVFDLMEEVPNEQAKRDRQE